MKHARQYLEELGLTKSESIIYLAGVAYGRPVGVQELQKQTAIKRPTIYHNVHLLESRGLVAKTVSLNRTLYTFQPPEHLERIVQADIRAAKQKLRTVARLTQELGSVEVSEATIVRQYDGIDGIKSVVDMALYCKNPEWLVIAPVENFFSALDEAFARYYLVTRKRHAITSKTLWEKPKIGGRLLSDDEIYERQPRYLPSGMQGKFTATAIAFDTKLAIITSSREQSAVIIESPEVSGMFRAMFEGLYEISTPYSPQV